MWRPVSLLGLAAGLVAFAGCRHACGDRCGPGLLSRVGAGRSVACTDPVVGVPVSNGGGGMPGMLIPGGGSSEQLPPPTDFLPKTGVPLAPPSAAPAGDPFGTLPPPKIGVPVGKGGN